jgi:riboflavin transporter FmnP
MTYAILLKTTRDIRMPKSTTTYFIASTALLSTLSIIFEIIPSFRVPWGMKIDFVGVIWVLSYFLYGLKESLSVSIITTLFILAYSPTGYVGAIMKFVATLPMFLAPATLVQLPFLSNKSSKSFNRILVITLASILALLSRVVIATVVNFYWAIPLWTGIPTNEILDNQILGFNGSILAFVVFVATMNLVQGIVDILVPWIVAYKFKLLDYLGTW